MRKSSWLGLVFLLTTAVSAWGDAARGADVIVPDADNIFAQIAAQKIDCQNRNLVPVTPAPITKHLLPLGAGAAAFQPAPRIATAEQLYEELLRQRESHAPYLKDLTPPLEDARVRVPLESFDWRIETDADRADFAATLAGQGQWERVKIPHYGGPMGRAVTYYRTEFDVTPAMLQKGALFVRFKGVDYKAHVFVNGAFLGSHEGLFAPFEFECTQHARTGKNVLLVKVVNDFIMLGNNAQKGFLPSLRLQGDKIYAAVGPGWDEPEVGWHHCSPGMGIDQDVAIEARPRISVHDIFVRPLAEEGKAEAWIEIFGCDHLPQNITMALSIHGQNFSTAPVVVPITDIAGQLRPVQQGVNLFKIPLTIPQPRLWSTDTPWLYQVQVKLMDEKGTVLDTSKRQFGLRTFRMEYVEEPKGRMYLNGKGIKLRGANTMGAFQQCVIRKDWQQLIDDILLAKITNMNFIRLTQRPVQQEIYDYCDRLGLMLQTDLPLFAWVRRNQFCEVVRQAEEMERLVRAHPSNILVTYINEPLATSWYESHRNLTRPEMTTLFEAADVVVRMANPDRVTKAVDGDYDPPGPGMPDNHCYPGWYVGHGIDLGLLHKGYWQPVKSGWFYGCGEFGSHGLDTAALMRKRYPKHWLPQSPEEEKTWNPSLVPGDETGNIQPYWFDRPDTLGGWVERSLAHQEWITRLQTEAFRRDRRLQSFAIHLFVDAFPAGYLMAIMDCERQPKPAWFAYRNALSPLAVSLRTDRRSFFSGQPMELEAWVCNDRHEIPLGATLHYQLEQDGKVIEAGAAPASVPALDTAYQGSVSFTAPAVTARSLFTARLGLLDSSGKVLHDAVESLTVFPAEPGPPLRRVRVLGAADGKAARVAAELACQPVLSGPFQSDDVILIDDFGAFGQQQDEIGEAVRKGARVVFLDLPAGQYKVGGSDIQLQEGPAGIHFVSRATGHALVAGFGPEDFKFWHDQAQDCCLPLVNVWLVAAADWKPVLISGQWVAATKLEGQGQWCVCQLKLAGRIAGNPVAAMFARRLMAQ